MSSSRSGPCMHVWTFSESIWGVYVNPWVWAHRSWCSRCLPRGGEGGSPDALTLTCGQHFSSPALHLETRQRQAVPISKLLKMYDKLKLIGGSLTQAKVPWPD